MSNRAKDLAERFELANAEFAAFMQEIPEAQWRRILGEGELRSVAALHRRAVRLAHQALRDVQVALLSLAPTRPSRHLGIRMRGTPVRRSLRTPAASAGATCCMPASPGAWPRGRSKPDGRHAA
jgi:hypothetical protein